MLVFQFDGCRGGGGAAKNLSSELVVSKKGDLWVLNVVCIKIKGIYWDLMGFYRM